MFDIYRDISTLLDMGESFCLATIIEKAGSGPREKGTKMIIKKDCSIIGTIGGGIVEALSIKLSKEMFEKKCSVVKSFSLSNNKAASFGMVCGGNMDILIENIDANNKNMAHIYSKACELKLKNENFMLISKMGKRDNECFEQEKWICTETGFFGCESEETGKVIKEARENFKDTRIRTVNVGGNSYLIEPAISRETVYIFGAGHISQKLANMTSMIDFDTVVLDDRSEFANRERFKKANDVKVVSSFANVCNYVRIDRESYVVIVTRGHAFDWEVLSQMLRTKAKYVGMIGSRSKIGLIYEKLKKEGFTQKDIDRVHAPIGLDINAQTPEEIAVSIAAQLV